MTFHLTLLTALIALRRNRLRTALTMLSLVIGTTSVITVFALGTGAYEAIEDDIATAGTNLIIVSAGNWTSAGVRMGMGSSSRLTADDAEAILREIPGVSHVIQEYKLASKWSRAGGTGPPVSRAWAPIFRRYGRGICERERSSLRTTCSALLTCA